MIFTRLDKATQTAILFGALVVASCGPEGASSSSAPAPKPKPLVGYGLVNAWHLIDPEPLAQALDDAGLGLTAIEWAPAWGSPKDPRCADGSTSITYPNIARQFVDTMRAHGIETLVNVVNANGCSQRHQADSYVVTAAQQIADQIGTDGVLLSVVSEPWADPEKAEHWTRIGASHWLGKLVLPDAGQNHRTGRQYWPIPFHVELTDVHYCSDPELLRDLGAPRADVLHSTDCGPIINPGPERAARFAALAAAGGSPLLVYDFKGLSPDYATIAAMGEAIRPRLAMHHR